MGKSVTPKYRLEIRDCGNRLGSSATPSAWRGRASKKALEDYIDGYHDSLKIGGVNQHVSISLGYIPFVNRAQIVEQKTGLVVAEWVAPTFMMV
ncbi:hypothetical protein UFOVP244_125 [uncultured Caudovirales phage]|uniref:Uncharacterized protein n=1 Tax=uncultured Caudovirales phage TaxID=2100421 RepID=A0A6J7WTG9_9CAUD|nr:hypothetical protein UFOVP244_125 [uncultured Caudovirales phage]